MWAYLDQTTQGHKHKMQIILWNGPSLVYNKQNVKPEHLKDEAWFSK